MALTPDLYFPLFVRHLHLAVHSAETKSLFGCLSTVEVISLPSLHPSCMVHFMLESVLLPHYGGSCTSVGECSSYPSSAFVVIFKHLFFLSEIFHIYFFAVLLHHCLLLPQ